VHRSHASLPGASDWTHILVPIASHGMAMTLWLSASLTLADPGQFWAELRFPDVLDVEPGASVVRPAMPWSFQLAGGT
jgi:hypothetical protein